MAYLDYPDVTFPLLRIETNALAALILLDIRVWNRSDVLNLNWNLS